MRICNALIALFLALLVATPAAAKDEDDYAKAAPFTAARFKGDVTEIEVEGTWYQLRAIDEVKAHDLVAFAKKTYGGRWQKRITEDLVEVLTKMGHKPGKTVSLDLTTAYGKPVLMPKVAMTRENRQAARRASDGQPRRPEPRPRRKDDDDDYPKLAPFTAARVERGNVEMEVNGVWYRLRSIDGIRGPDLINFAREQYGAKLEKRIVEDLVEVLTRMGKRPGDTVALELERMDDGKPVLLPKVPMTKENRNQAWRARSKEARGAPVRRVRRKHAKSAHPDFKHLTDPVKGARGRVLLSRKQALEDLDQLEWLLKNVHSYATLRGHDIEASFDAARLGIGPRISRHTLAILMMKLIALTGDGHARVAENPARVLAPGFLSFLISDAGGRAVAYLQDRSGLLDAKHPYVVKIDGLDIEIWVAAAARLVAHGSPQLVRRRAFGILRHIQHVRRELGRDERSTIDVELESEDGERRVSKQVQVADRKPLYGTWPRTQSRVLPGDIAYLRVDRMEDMSGFPRAWAKDLNALEGMIIDVRGNGGGTRDALRRVLPHFLAPGDAVVVNVGAYRMAPDATPDPEGHLHDRHLFPRTSSRWSDADKRLLDAFAQEFTPRWQLPAGFSDWHYLVLRNAGDGQFVRPTIILIDDGCFSATDVFVGAFAGRKNVTLMGTATSGGSGRSQPYTLANSHLRLRLSSMASFRPSGALYDTQGIAPDVGVPVKPSDLIGTTDSALEAAIERLK